MYIYVLVQCDIGYTVTFLACFAVYCSQAYYDALKNIASYLCSTKDWGIIYHCPQPISGLPMVPLEDVPKDASLPTFPPSSSLCAYVDAANAIDINT